MSEQLRSLGEFTAEVEAMTAAMMTEEPQEIASMRCGEMENTAGSYGQYFGTWDIAHGMLRDYSMYTLYPITALAEDAEIDLISLSKTVDALDPAYSNYLRYSGFPKMGKLAVELRGLIRASTSRSDVVAALRAFTAYTNRLQAWSFHYFPWGLGKHFRYDEARLQDAPLPVADLGATRACITRGQRIRISWEPLGITVNATLASEENPELCGDVVAALPFTVIQDHAVVTGESMYAWTPVLSTAPIHLRERICDAPVGRLRYSQSTGQKFIVQYGPTTEDLSQPVLGEIDAADAGKLEQVGRAVWDSTFDNKKLIWMTVELA
ncbi:hypothetical protein BCh11DRAFT_05991 [Burkholderia sp. Ch1-1]|uniref:Cucumopine synthase C-terminal helical bundle domain-containing protein n=1 Tax=Paraburkholderia dioscoreae TaxID=2604047 RepID=A0A5Q4YTN1_9BURK|nr:MULTISPECIES: hypothetical protein [Paraburkholderia]EIF30500.1 hypothetical protein BCh11DRAFT_05991 [Burkholderia sp. Ch1-1]MDR8395076.1 hypothetical protein [Paraburkholderia sp. USG1]VVD29401.1 conserved protein of unknown function [Paraburkholderia dioscoreae]